MNNPFVSHCKSFFQAPHSSGSRAVQLNLIWRNICCVEVVNTTAKFPVPFIWKELEEVCRLSVGRALPLPLLKRRPSLSCSRHRSLCSSRNSSSFPLLCTHGLTSLHSPRSLEVVSLMKEISERLKWSAWSSFDWLLFWRMLQDSSSLRFYWDLDISSLLPTKYNHSSRGYDPKLAVN